MPTIETNRARIVKRLEAEGWTLARHGSQHDVYARASALAIVPRHRTLTIGVARNIAKVAGWI